MWPMPILTTGAGIYPAAGGGGASLPSGAVGIWYAENYDATIARLPNSAAGTADVANYCRTPRRLFTGSLPAVYDSNNITFTEAAATAHDGTNDATRLLCAAATWNLYANISLGAGTWMVAAWVKSNTGSSQDFKMGNLSSPATKTATTSWQRFTTTFVLGSTTTVNCLFAGDVSAAAADLLICDAHLFSGSTDLAPNAVEYSAGHIEFGTEYNAGGLPSYASNILDCSATGTRGFLQWPSGTQKTNTCTVLALMKKSADGFNASYQPWFSKYGTSWSDWSAGLVMDSNLVGIEHASGGATAPSDGSPPPYLFDGKGNGFAVVTFRVNGTTGDSWVNKVKLRSKSGLSLSAQTAHNMCFNMLQQNYTAGNQYAAIAMYDRALSDNEIKDAVTYLQSYAVSKSVTLTTMRTVFVEGHSIAAGSSGSPGYSNLMANSFSPGAFGQNFGTGGAAVADLVSRWSTTAAAIADAIQYGTVVLFVDIGVNDLSSGGPYASNPSGFTAALASYLDTARATGAKVVACTLLPRTADAQYLTDRATANTTISGWVGTHADALCDFAGVAGMGADGDASNTTNYTSGLHPTTVGHALLEPTARAAINGL